MGLATSEYGIVLCDGRVGRSNEDLAKTIFVPYDCNGKQYMCKHTHICIHIFEERS